MGGGRVGLCVSKVGVGLCEGRGGEGRVQL